MGLVGLDLVANSLLYPLTFFYSCFFISLLFYFFSQSLTAIYSMSFPFAFSLTFLITSLWFYLISPSFLDGNFYIDQIVKHVYLKIRWLYFIEADMVG